jgi:iron complex transport system ATP-binding protein
VSSGGSGGPLLAARGLGWHAAGRRILGPLELDVERGESVAVVGPNGAGKTTLLRLLAGLLAPSAGEVRLAGRPLASYSRKGLARRIAYVPQLRPIRVPLTVEAIVLLGRYPHLGAFQLAPAARDLEAVAEALRLTEIEHLRRRPVEELSGGERQSVYIAAALAQEAEILVLDEPTTHLDPRHEREIAVLLPRLRRRGRANRPDRHPRPQLRLAHREPDRRAQGGRDPRRRPARRAARARTLAALFEAPFEVVRGGERPMTLLRLDAS